MLTEADEDQKIAMATARIVIGVNKCNADYAAGYAKYAVARTECINDTLALMRPLYPYPDLLDRYLINRREIAESFGTGKMSLADANEKFSEERSKMLVEERRRAPGSQSEKNPPAQGTRHSAYFDSVFKATLSCRQGDTSVNCL